MKRIALLTSIAVLLAGPVLAQAGPGTTYDVTFSNRTSPVTDTAFAHFNADIDSTLERNNSETLTIAANTPAFGADIFARIKAEAADED
jgi:PBP1b-binding outer membrane lipoprotein LpoB